MNWLLLRGLAREQRHWASFGEIFARRLQVSDPSAKIFFLDLPGTGTEIARPSPLTIAAIRDDLRERWTPLRTKDSEPWGILGVSLGGMLGIDWVAAYPDDFRAVVAVNSSAANLSPPWQRLKLGVIFAAAAAGRAANPEAKEMALLAMTTRLVKDPRALARRWAALALDDELIRKTMWRQLFAAFRFHCPAGVSVPALILVGAHDTFTDPRCSARLAARLHARIATHAEAGHEITLDDPEWVAEVVAKFSAVS